ncbi:hypothetical protein I0C86_35920 [Plantactinospora sp. S1510]|uniref:Uncharacterized protein n=1 Tax=Plantactinospora alkalitolerans TaxID=2789879 RepID=A0ABS0H7I6_9ACTN|nr:hypothetical protein [Plantactinospora alkalitolerans]MBF9134279.1 hypothetical protein [Plantactinospora alkalitolerans]
MKSPYARPPGPTDWHGRRRLIASMLTVCAVLASLLIVPAAPASAVDDYPTLNLDGGSSTEYRDLLDDIKAGFMAEPISEQPDPLVVMTEFRSHGVFPVELSYLGESVYLIVGRDDLYVVGYYRTQGCAEWACGVAGGQPRRCSGSSKLTSGPWPYTANSATGTGRWRP